MSNTPYGEKFFRDLQAEAPRSAEVIVPIVLDHVSATSVCDLGCGDGTWLKVFRLHGVDDISGVDGAYVDRQILKIPSSKFIPHDLTKPFMTDRKFDLAISLEVVEHLPEHCARLFIESLTRLANLVLFSAAIPLQGGTSHINEQWQGYWAKLFRERIYVAIDCIRPAIWEDERVEGYYRQNILIYCHERALKTYPKLAECAQPSCSPSHTHLVTSTSHAGTIAWWKSHICRKLSGPFPFF